MADVFRFFGRCSFEFGFFFYARMDYIGRLREECDLRGFSLQTRKTYAYVVSSFLRFIDERGLTLDKIGVKSYLLSVPVSANTARLYHAALKFFFAAVLENPSQTWKTCVKGWKPKAKRSRATTGTWTCANTGRYRTRATASGRNGS